jgi:cytochrome c553
MNRWVVRDISFVVMAIALVTTLIIAIVPRPGTPQTVRTAVCSSCGPHTPVAPRKLDGVALGKRLFETKGCIGCHTTDGTPRVGPTLAHDFGTRVALADGSSIVVDEAYIRESLLSPQAKARSGYPPSMPSFAGLLDDRQIRSLTDYIASLR